MKELVDKYPGGYEAFAKRADITEQAVAGGQDVELLGPRPGAVEDGFIDSTNGDEVTGHEDDPERSGTRDLASQMQRIVI